ncbi:MAG TPA: hypothetical protein VGQ83_15120 [Polyangia bacterium]|jgi:hypothetical protein
MHLTARLMISLTLLLLAMPVHAKDVPVAVHPGQRLGPIILGTAAARLKDLRADAGDPPDLRHSGPYDVFLDAQKRVIAVQLEVIVPSAGVRVGSTTVPRRASAAMVAEALGTCRPPQQSFNYSLRRCRGAYVVEERAAVKIGVTADQPADDAPLVLEPGRRLGPVALGMSLADLRALRVEPVAGFGPDSRRFRVGVLQLMLDPAGRVASVEAEIPSLPAGLRLGPTVIPATVTAAGMAALLQSCRGPQHNTGATVWECRGTTVLAAGPPGIPMVRVARPACLKDRGCPDQPRALAKCPADLKPLPLRDALDQRDRLVGRKVAVRGPLTSSSACTEMACGSNACCNHCQGELVLGRPGAAGYTYLLLRHATDADRYRCRGDDSLVCCQLDARGQDVIARGTFARDRSSTANRPLLLDAELCVP